ncbi:MAG: isoprenylcysteine carboxylmethyltransferase family protein [Chloroflexota bacterium]
MIVTLLKSILFFFLVPVLLLGFLPWRLASMNMPLFDAGLLRYFAFLLWLAGAVIELWCFWNFTLQGRGTPAPIDPPKELVAVGLYRYVRNPMYVAGILALLGWLIWSPSLPLILAPFVFFLATHLFVTLYEEPHLRKLFGQSYESYLQKVPRWIPKFRN